MGIMLYRGVFNVRLSPEKHKEAVYEVTKQGITLNQFVVRSIDAALTK